MTGGLLERAPILELVRRATRDDTALDAEQSLLGGLLVDRHRLAFDRVAQIIGPEHFATEDHRVLWNAIFDEHEEGGVVDVTTVGERLSAHGRRDLLSYAACLAQNTPSLDNITRYADLVRR